MDINDLRSIVTVLSALAFAGIVAWTLSRRHRAGFDEAAMLPFVDSRADGDAGEQTTGGSTERTANEGRA